MSDLTPANPPPPFPPPPYPPPPPPPAPRRVLPALVAILLALLLVAAAVTVPLVLGGDADEVASDGSVDLSAVQEYDGLEPTHTSADIDYPQTPPAGGPHDPVWLDCGVYDEPVRDENAVHDLEHGTVWITYDPDLDADDVATLAGLLPQNGILSPHDGLDAPVVVTVWSRQLSLTGADDARLPLFIDTFGGGETAPEPFASCAGGVRDPDAGTGTNV
ncbi:MAG: hypothetical protein JWN91_3997 [Nocardioides sp.]|nr:hypothetical protein [Nocardioides sp.]